jgi:hypothetical protein
VVLLFLYGVLEEEGVEGVEHAFEDV